MNIQYGFPDLTNKTAKEITNSNRLASRAAEEKYKGQSYLEKSLRKYFCSKTAKTKDLYDLIMSEASRDENYGSVLETLARVYHNGEVLYEYQGKGDFVKIKNGKEKKIEIKSAVLSQNNEVLRYEFTDVRLMDDVDEYHFIAMTRNEKHFDEIMYSVIPKNEMPNIKIFIVSQSKRRRNEGSFATIFYKHRRLDIENDITKRQ